MKEHVTFQWDDDDDIDDDVRFVLDQNAGFLCSANLLKQLSINRHFAAPRHIILSPT